MKKTETFFVISNYNTDPEPYLEYCTNYHIYDQSDDKEFKGRLKAKYNRISFVENSGHSITNYFRFIIDHYDDLPEFMMFMKANMIGRHLSQEYFDRVYDNKFYTCLYADRSWEDKCGVAYQLYDGAFLERNNAWYASAKPFRYFETYNELLSFIFKDPIIPKWLLFCPGACFIVPKNRILQYRKEFYENLKYLVSYTFFPNEAYHVERMLHVIFCGNHEIMPYMSVNTLYMKALKQIEDNRQTRVTGRRWSLFKRGVSSRINGLLYNLMIK